MLTLDVKVSDNTNGVALDNLIQVLLVELHLQGRQCFRSSGSRCFSGFLKSGPLKRPDIRNLQRNLFSGETVR